MSEFTDRLLRDMQRTYDYFAANPGATVQQFTATLHTVKEGTVFTWCKNAVRRGEMTRIQGQRGVYGGNVGDTYFIVPDKRPMALPPTLPRKPYKFRVDKDVRRMEGKAKQIGIQRDPLVAALFGAAGATA